MKLATWLLACLLSWPALACDLPRDKHGKIIRSQKAISDFRKAHPCPSTGKVKGACPGFVVDHVVPLCAMGKDSLANLQWQALAISKKKDQDERRLCQWVYEHCKRQ